MTATNISKGPFRQRIGRAFLDLSVVRKLQLIVGTVRLGLLVVVALGMRSASGLGQELSRVGRQQLPAVRNMTLVDMMHDGIRAGVYGLLLADARQDDAAKAASAAELQELCDNLNGYIGAIDQLELMPSTRAAIDAARPAIAAYIATAQSMSGQAAAGMAEFERQFDVLEEKLEALGELIEQDADNAVAAGEALAAGAVGQSLVTLLLVGGLAFCIAIVVGRAISRPLGAAVVALESGELGLLAQADSKDEIGRMARAVTDTVAAIERQKGEMARVVAMMENAPINMLYADREGVIQYQNTASNQNVARIAATLGLDAGAIVGAPIQAFFGTAKEQPQGLTDGIGLPFEAVVTCGAEVVRMLATALHGKQGEFLGPMLTWEIQTEQVRLQRQNEAMAEERRQQAELEQQRIARQAEADRAAAEAEQRRMAEQALQDKEQAEALQRKIDRLLAAVDEAAKGDLRQQIAVEGDDAVSKVGGALDVLFEDLRVSIAEIARNAGDLAGSSEGLRQSSTSMHSAAEITSRELTAATGASEEVNRSVQGVALATDELSARIREIAESASQATRVAASGVEAATATETTMDRLAESSQKIGEVIKLINAIAQQTNLLALNATIEAARAGEAGRGFAVVANEVKELANETARATGEISQRIETIQGDARVARDSIGRIGSIVNEISDIQATIAVAVEEQTATTKEIARTLAEAANGSTEVVATITRVTRCASETSAGAQNSLQSAKMLSEMADNLSKLVGAFRY